MRAIDDLAGKYLEEIRLFLPVSSVVTFVAGVSLLGRSHAGHGSLWLDLLRLRYASVWYFRDQLTSLQVWKILVLAGAALIGSYLCKMAVKFFASAGRKAIRAATSSIYERAAAVAQTGGFNEAAFNAAKIWRSSREGNLWGAFKLASTAFSMAAVSLISFIESLSLVDLIPLVLFISIGLVLAWRFSLAYFSVYLPERVLADAALGLLEPRALEDLRRSPVTGSG